MPRFHFILRDFVTIMSAFAFGFTLLINVQRPAQAADFDYYILALSWSPSYCATNPRAASSRECTTGSHSGFVVHGLWPQRNDGQISNCVGDRFVPPNVLATTSDIYPDRGLAIHEWRQHGLCSGLSAQDFFSAVRLASQHVVLPKPFAELTASQNMATSDILQAFFKSNTGLNATNTAMTCRDGNFSEIRICLAKDLKSYVSCPQVVSRSCRTPQVTVPKPL